MFGTNYTGGISDFRSASEINSAMGRVYGHMSLAVIVSMIVSYWVGTTPELLEFFFTGVLNFAALMGLSFAMIFAIFTMGSIVSAFMGAAILFAVMSGYGYFTKQSLDSLGKFMFVGLIAIIIASIVNIFIGSTVMQMVISALAIIIFLGLTAYDTQKIREELSVEASDTAVAEIRGALTLYMDFINLFLNLLQLFGDRKS